MPEYSVNVENIKSHFEDDLTRNRCVLAEMLEKYFINSPVGKVAAIHSEWGTGKTWFAERYKDLVGTQANARAVIYSAFEYDTNEDPLPSLMATVLDLVPVDKKATILAKCAPIVKAAVPKLALASLDLLIGRLLHNPKAYARLIEAASEAAESAAGQLAERWLKKFEDDNKHLADLKVLLKSIDKKIGRRLLIIDELDRCNPKFAIQVIDRVKHFFEGSGIDFLIFVNRTQLESHLECEFGPHVHKSGHLNKYVDIWFPLNNADRRVPVDAYLAMWHGGNVANHDVTCWVKLCSGLFSASFRDLHRCIELKTCICGSGPVDPIMVPLIFMKVCRPDLYEQLVIGDREGAILVHEEIEKLRKDQAFNVSRDQPMFLEFINMIPGRFAPSQVDERLLQRIRKTPGL